MAVETASGEVRTLGDLVELSLGQIRISSPLFGQQMRRWGRPCSPIASAKGPVNSSSRGSPGLTRLGRPDDQPLQDPAIVFERTKCGYSSECWPTNLGNLWRRLGLPQRTKATSPLSPGSP